MSRAGREPAEDIKRRLVAACQEVGLTVKSARMCKVNHAGVRVVYSEANIPDWPHEVSTVCVQATVDFSGRCSAVDIRCTATDDDPMRLDSPCMRRGQVSFAELVEQLRETLDEREQVIAATKMGLTGPYRFSRSVWVAPNTENA